MEAHQRRRVGAVRRRRTGSSVLLAAVAALVVACSPDKPTVPMAALAEASSTGLHTISGSVLGPDGQTICDHLPAGFQMVVRAIDPVHDGGGLYAGSQIVSCPANTFSIVVAPGVYRLQVGLTLSSAIGTLPWRYLDPDDVAVDAEDVDRTILVPNGVPLEGAVTVDGQPVAGVGLALVYDFPRLQLFAAGLAVSGDDGGWDEQGSSRSPMIVQNHVRLGAGLGCDFFYGGRLLVGLPSTSFQYPDEVSRIDCAFTDEVSPFTHELTRMVLTPMAGDVGGQSSEFHDDPGRGWGVQFPVTTETPRRRGAGNQLYLGGLLLAIDPDIVLSAVNLFGWAECGPACRDLGLDGEMSVEDAGGKGRKVTWSYTDALSPQRVGLRVIQRSFDGRPPADYVLFQFQIRNVSRSVVTFHAGFYADWDVDGIINDDFAATDLGGRLMYQMNEGGIGAHVGTLLLGPSPASGNFVVDLAQPDLSLQDQVRALSGAISRPSLTGFDLAYFHGLGPITLAPRSTAEFWMAVVAGENQAQMLASAAAAEQDVLTRQARPGLGLGAPTATQTFAPRPGAANVPPRKASSARPIVP